MVAMMTTVHVRAVRIRKGWTLIGVEYPAVSEVTRLDQAAENMREPLAYLSGQPEADLDIQIEPEVPDEYWSQRAEATRLSETANQARTSAAEHSRRAARVLADAGLPLRDIGAIMGISHQRAQQLLAA
jgi:hypothetical protein